MTKKKSKVRGGTDGRGDGPDEHAADVSNEGSNSLHTMNEWRRLRGMKNRLDAALLTLDREAGNGPIAFEHFLSKCRDIVGREEA